MALWDITNKAHTEFYNAEMDVSKKYGWDYSSTVYDWMVPFSRWDSVDYYPNNDQCFDAKFTFEDVENECFVWKLTIPFNPDKLSEYVEKFKNKCIDIAENNRRENEAKENERTKQYEKLKKQFLPLQSEFGDK